MTKLMPLSLTISCFSKIQIGFTFLVPAVRPTRVVPEKGPLNGCVCVCACVRACVRACVCVGLLCFFFFVICVKGADATFIY